MVTPHYDADGIILYVGDAREILPTLPHGRDGFDMLLTDPPYGVGAKATGMRVAPLALEKLANDETRDVGTEVVAMAWKCLKFFRHAYVFGPFPMTALAYSAGCAELIWDKGMMNMGNLEHPWGSQHEPIQFAMRADGTHNAKRGGLLARVRSGSVLRHLRPNASGARHHITAKPVSLLRELIEMSTRHGDVILDPMAGSGSSLVAALIEGRGAVGIELEVQWADVAAERLRKLTESGNPFAFGAAS